ncbi:MAG: transcriptional regulator NrdR [Alphaproteobacteria bacterium RIFCSPLOWO2_01_FULL_45_8]|nr:MAG: transcriptional regulator NrdR [Alphaproteobacteria bacterium GWB1_45_5]OFW76744.1 MAG: transcriptional regulator NrdR [Alphaproteobacteria bacterium GWA1_45_9]OFW89827.1 MAG: transcriptional regulator NrdR [Alphaproteobacteria bacterium RIFCSPHIGHO2_01_FULL_41_14]OFW96091.1 MAG: transcriptional regulator NrdR [Alphaproteobacteria bacterium RIFCSPLOWO2_01_FULL_45_8]HCI48959.1 transcriptional regulator NrdR [Holosporales bacterium]
MRCPFCGCIETQVKDSRPSDDYLAIRRRRFCPECVSRFTTYERIQLSDLVVVKKKGERVPFDREKMARSICTATRKRSIDAERIEKLVNGVVRRLEMVGDPEISSKVIGEMVLEALKDLDLVSYLRFASVYKDFKTIEDFHKFILE